MNISAIRPARAVRRIARSALMRAADWLPGERSPVQMRLPRGSRDVALTFDDGPDPEVTPRVLELLASNDWRATFFVVGRRAEKHPALLRSIATAGHTIGNHTYSHIRCSSLKAAEFSKEVDRTDQIIRDACPTPASPPLFRPPWGSITPLQTAFLWRQGRSIGFWSLSCDDSVESATVATAGKAALRARPRDIVLLHDIRPLVLELLQILIPDLRRRGIKSVSLR